MLSQTLQAFKQDRETITAVWARVLNSGEITWENTRIIGAFRVIYGLKPDSVCALLPLEHGEQQSGSADSLGRKKPTGRMKINRL